MREKHRRIPRRTLGSPTRTDGLSTRDWVLANEVGWGMPHGAIAVLAATAVALRSLGMQPGRFATWVAGRGRGRHT